MSLNLNKDIPVPTKLKAYYKPEPTWENFDALSDLDKDIKVFGAYRWYNDILEQSDRYNIVIKYLKDNKYSKDDIEAVEKTPVWKFPSAMVYLCRMQSRGYVLKGKQKEYFETSMKSIIDFGNGVQVVEKPSDEPQKPKISVQDRIKKVVAETHSELDYEIDNLVKDFDYQFNCYNWLKARKIKPAVASQIAEKFNPLMSELQIAVTGKDKDINEAYSVFQKKDIKRLFGFVSDIVEDCNKWSSNKKKQRAPRKARTKTVDQVVKGVKYLAEDTKLKLASVNPTTMLAAKEAWLFIPKNRLMFLYVANDLAGLGIKGSKITNFNPKESKMKKLRKPEEFLKVLMEENYRKAIREFDNLKVKPLPVKGKINKHTMILKVKK